MVKSNAIPSSRPAIARGFTLVELLVVVAIIGVVLGIGLPAFNSMSAQSRLSKSRQLLQGALTRASVLSIADRNLIAVRIFPAAWDQIGQETASNTSGASAVGSQVIALYKYVTRSERPLVTGGTGLSDPSMVSYVDRFERIKESPAIILPPDVWMAPVEALLTGPNNNRAQVDRSGNGSFDSVDSQLDELRGPIGNFDLDCDPRTNAAQNMLVADDFLMIFDPQQGLLNSRARPAWKMFALDPRPAAGVSVNTGGLETGGEYTVVNGRGRYVVGSTFQRMNYTGAVLYNRERFALLGANADSADRGAMLARDGLPLYVTGGSGTLTLGGQ